MPGDARDPRTDTRRSTASPSRPRPPFTGGKQTRNVRAVRSRHGCRAAAVAARGATSPASWLDGGSAALLLVEGGAPAPRCDDCLEDWIRVPADEADVRARVDALAAPPPRPPAGAARARPRRAAALLGRVGLVAAGRGPPDDRADRALRDRGEPRAARAVGLAQGRARVATRSTCTCCGCGAASHRWPCRSRRCAPAATCSRRSRRPRPTATRSAKHARPASSSASAARRSGPRHRSHRRTGRGPRSRRATARVRTAPHSHAGLGVHATSPPAAASSGRRLASMRPTTRSPSRTAST